MTVTPTFEAVYDTFAVDRPDVELNELPNVCSHFVVDRDGTIYQLVSLELICRHTVGLNDHAIGIEHVGATDAEVLGNSAQMRASLEADRLASLPLRDLDGQRDRAQREPLVALPPRAGGLAADPDARRLEEAGHGRLPVAKLRDCAARRSG